MKLKAIVATVALGLAASGSAFADAGVSQQIAQLQAQLHALQNQVNHMGSGKGGSSVMGGLVSTNANLTNNMLNNFNGVGREMYLLQARKHNTLADHSVYVGGYGEFDAVYNHSNANTQTGTTHRETASVVNKGYSALKIRQADLTATATINQWTTMFLDLGTPRASLATTNSADYNADTTGDKFGVQQAYLVMGNLNQSPIYGFIGKKDVDFGQFASVNPYSQPLNRLAFQGLATQAGVGFMQNGFDGTLSVMNGGYSNNHPHTGTRNNGNIGNFALNFGYGQNGLASVDGLNWHVGAGFLRGTGFAEQTATNGTNGAWDLNAKASYQNFDVLAEYTQTTKNVANSNDLKAWQLGGDYKLPVMGRKSVASLSYSQVADGHGTQNTISQYVAGFRNETWNNVWLGVEYAYNHNTAQAALATSGSAITGVTGSAADNNTLTFDVTAYF